ncbi:MAG: hypothetical protein ABIK25_07180 [Pseudomonadota bacterium]
MSSERIQFRTSASHKLAVERYAKKTGLNPSEAWRVLSERGLVEQAPVAAAFSNDTISNTQVRTDLLAAVAQLNDRIARQDRLIAELYVLNGWLVKNLADKLSVSEPSRSDIDATVSSLLGKG